MERLTTWGVLAVVGAVVGFGVYLMASSHAPSFLAWLGAVSVFLNFVQSAMIGNARRGEARAKQDVAMYRDFIHAPMQSPSHEPLAPQFEVQEGPDPQIALEEWTRQKEEQETWRQPAGFKQGHMNTSPTLSVRGWYRHPVTGKYVKRQ